MYVRGGVGVGYDVRLVVELGVGIEVSLVVGLVVGCEVGLEAERNYRSKFNRRAARVE